MAQARKTPPKTRKPAHGRGELRTGNPGNAGGSGRPPNAFKDFLADLRKDPEALAALKSVATDPSNRNCIAAWKLATEYDEQKPAKKVEVSQPPMSNAERAAAIQRILERA